ncbi:MAG: RNA methyltransferase [Desulfobacter sp.]|nr:RNA methyltransferase [Desulfobacter sp.]
MRGVCQKELAALPQRLEPLLPAGADISNTSLVPGGISFVTRLSTACLANLFLGSPTRILMRVASFKADQFSLLEKKIKAVDWELFLPEHTRLDIKVSTKKSRLFHSDAIADRCLPLILDRISGNQTPKAPYSQTLMIRADHDRFELSLDMSGIPLFKRGIKQRVVQAPLRETLAFAVLKALDFSRDDILVDPMCGSGTFSLEGAMIQSALPPGFFRHFAFEAWPGFGPKGFAHVLSKIKHKIILTDGPSIFASDIDRTAVENLNAVAHTHKALERIQAAPQDFFQIIPPKTKRGKGVVVLNPPYGRRLCKGLDMKLFFKEIGQKLAKDFSGWRAGIILPDRHSAAALNLPLTPMPIFHGGLDLYAGIGKIP